MKKIGVIGVLLALFLIVIPSFVLGKSDRENRTAKVVTISSDEVINRDFVIKSGEIVEVLGTINGDLVAAGGQVIVDGMINGDLLAAGGIVTVLGEVTQDVRVAGGQVSINGIVGRNLTAIGGDVMIGGTAQLKGGAILAGGNILLSAPVKGDALLAGGSVVISGPIEGDVEVMTESLLLSTKAKIGGDLTYTSRETKFEKDASVSGQITKDILPPLPSDFDPLANISQEIENIKVYSRIIGFFPALMIGLFMLRLFPNYTKDASLMIGEVPGKSLLVGFLTLILTPFLLIFTLITIVGIPIFVFVLCVYVLVIYLSKVFFSYFLAIALNKKLKVTSPYLSYFFGLVAYYLLRFIPLIGGVVSAASLLFGMGAMVLACRHFYREAYAKKII
jgi:hypothetical protein